MGTCFPLQVQIGRITGNVTQDLCCRFGGWPFCWMASDRIYAECCRGWLGEEEVADELGVIASQRASTLASLEELAETRVQLVTSPAGFLERTRRPTARLLARLLEAHCCGRGGVHAKGSPAPVQVVEVGVQRGRFGHSLLTALQAATTAPGVTALRSRRPREWHALQELPSEASPGTWATGPGCLRGQVRYVAVDLWQQQGAEYNESGNAGWNTQLTNLRSTLDLLAPFWPSVRIIQEESVRAARLFDAGSLHLVYLDARHDFAAVWEDLRAWWPVLRRGGFLAGDDFHDDVLSAVTEFATEQGVEVNRMGSVEFLLQRPMI